jgi:integrase
MTREELTLFFDHCDARVHSRQALRRKGSLTAFRDATLFKVIYAWGLRRQEAAMLDVSDFGPNPHRSSFGRYGTLSVRFGKASRGGAPKRRNVLTVFDWAVEILEQYVDEVRPLYGRPEHPALWLTERGGRIPSGYVTERFAEYRDELGLPRELSPHALRTATLRISSRTALTSCSCRRRSGIATRRRPRCTPESAATSKTRRCVARWVPSSVTRWKARRADGGRGGLRVAAAAVAGPTRNLQLI